MAEPTDKTEFPVHNLDVVSLQEIFKNLTLVDVFELSFATDEVRNAVREACLPIQTMLVSFDSDMPTIHLTGKKHEFLWTFGYPNELEFTDGGVYQIGKFHYDCKRSTNGYHTQHYDVEHGMITALKYLVSIFDCSEATIKELSIDVGVIDDSRSLCQNFTKFKCIERLAIHQSVDREGKRLNLTQNIEWIMSNLNVDELYLGVDLLEHRLIRTPEGEFDIRPVPVRIEKALNINHIALKYADWVTPEDLLKLDVQSAILEENKLTGKDINAFIHQWLNSTSDKLCWMKIKLDASFQQEEATAGLDLQEDTYKESNIKCSCPYLRREGLESEPFVFPDTSKQIKRENGTGTATISFNDDTFFFHIKNDGPITPPLVAIAAEVNEEQRRLIERIQGLAEERRNVNDIRRIIRNQNVIEEMNANLNDNDNDILIDGFFMMGDNHPVIVEVDDPPAQRRIRLRQRRQVAPHGF